MPPPAGVASRTDGFLTMSESFPGKLGHFPTMSESFSGKLGHFPTMSESFSGKLGHFPTMSESFSGRLGHFPTMSDRQLIPPGYCFSKIFFRTFANGNKGVLSPEAGKLRLYPSPDAGNADVGIVWRGFEPDN